MSVLDASAVLALLQRETGAAIVLEYLDGALMSTVNGAEVAAKLVDLGMPVEMARSILEALPIEFHGFGLAEAWSTAEIREETRRYGLALGDRACVALGLQFREPVITADSIWSGLDLGTSVVTIR